MQKHLDEFEARAVRLVAVSVDPPHITLEHCRRMGYTYTFLADTDTTVLQLYDLVHEGGGRRDADISRPAEFLVDTTGTIRWVNLSDDYRIRARPEDILKVLDDLGVRRAPARS